MKDAREKFYLSPDTEAQAIRGLCEEDMKRMCRELSEFEKFCASQSDEIQQAAELEIVLTSEGVKQATLRFRWHPGYQRAMAVQS